MIVHMIGNSHLRPAGVWSLNAGKDEALATLRSAVERCDEYPQFTFSFGEIWAYQLVEQIDPKLFRLIKKLVRRKQWHITHGLFSLMNPHVMSAEMWRRQVTFGHAYCSFHFGTTPKVAINLEATSMPESYLDQLLDAGYKGLVFHNGGAKIPGMESPVFRWANEKGQELLCYRISPSYRTRSHDLYGQIIESVEAGSLSLGHALCFYGIGNHGGGPSKENIEYILEHESDFEGVELKFSALEDFFDEAWLMSDSFPVHKGPIGDPTPGQFSNRFQTRQNQRKAESALIQIERLYEDYGSKYQVRTADEKLDAAWVDLMMSSNACYADGTYIDSNLPMLNAMQLRAELNAHEWIYEVTRTWARENLENINYQQIAIFNTSDQDQDVWIEHEPNLDLDEWGDRWLCDPDGNVVPMQLLQTEAPDPNLTRILFRAKLKARACAQYLIRDFSLLEDGPVKQDEKEDPSFRVYKPTLENSLVTLRFSQQSITRIASAVNREQNYLGRLGMSFALYHDKYDAAVTGQTNYDLPFIAGTESEGWEEEENGRLRISMVNHGMIHQSRFEWRVRLYRDDDRIYHSFRIHFQEQEKLLQLNIQLEEKAEHWVDATSAGSQHRECSSREYPFHGWTRSMNKKHQFAVISRDFFSFNHNENNLGFTILRSPEVACKRGVEESEAYPRNRYTDQGVHEIEFIIIPDSKDRDLEQELESLKHPPIVMDRYEGMNRPPWKNSTPPRLQEKNETRARADGKMSHLSES